MAHVYDDKAFFICYEYEEITPILKGTWRYKQSKSGSLEEVSELTKAEEIRSLIETQERILLFLMNWLSGSTRKVTKIVNFAER